MSDISEKFIEDMVDKVIVRLTTKLDELDISLDYIGAILSGHGASDLKVRQKGLGRYAVASPIAATSRNQASEPE